MIEAGSFTFFGDVAQQIYGSRLSWRDSGIDINKIWRFDVNYRNPATITAFAKAITQIKYWRQDGDMVEAASQIAEGLLCLCARVSFEERNCSSVLTRLLAQNEFSACKADFRRRSGGYV